MSADVYACIYASACVCVLLVTDTLLRSREREALAVRGAVQSAGFFVKAGIMEECDTSFKHD